MKKAFLFVACLVGFWAGGHGQIITTIAGNGTGGYSGDGGAATNANISAAYGIALDGNENLYIADMGNYRIRKVSPQGIITTIAGNGLSGHFGDGGPATMARISDPYLGIAVDATGNLYFCEYSHRKVRKVSTSNIITTIAGGGSNFGDGGPATDAQLGGPYGLATDGNNNIYLSDHADQRIRKISSTGIITTIAGNRTAGYSGDNGPATAAALNYPGPIVFDGSGNLYFSDMGNNVVRKITNAGIITTYAGSGASGYTGDGGPATAAELTPWGIAIDNSGNVYISDAYNHVVRKIDTAGIITTVSGNGMSGYNGSGGSATAATLSFPGGIAMKGSGNLYIADVGNGRIRKISPPPITGPNNVCVSSTITLSNQVLGGTWSSSNTSVATIGSNTGIVSGAVTGTVTISYQSSTSGSSIAVLAVNPMPSSISGATSVCEGVYITLSDSVTGAIWESSDTDVITVDSGVVTGVTAGTAIITYGFGGTCSATTTITVDPLPSAITGGSFVCQGATVTLSDATTSGIWSSSAAGIAIIGSGTGIVTGLSPGTATISYSLGACDLTNTIVVHPFAGTISGATSFPAYTAITLISNISGGEWSSGNSSIAAVGSASGIVTGDAIGTATITYTITNSCGSATTTISLAVVPPPTNPITTVAGNGTNGYGGDGGSAIAAEINCTGAAVDESGNIFVVDADLGALRKVNTSGIINTITGVSTYGTGPSGVAIDGSGNIYVAEPYNQRIRKINTSGIVRTIAGNGTAGFSGDGGAATSAKLNSPIGVAVDRLGNIYIEDAGNSRIRKVNTFGVISTLASFVGYGIATDTLCNVYTASSGRIFKINTSGVVVSIGGNGIMGFSGDGGPATAAALLYPAGVATDRSGNVYLAEAAGHRIRKINPSGIITTLAGTGFGHGGVGNYNGDCSAATAADLSYPQGAAVDRNGNIYIPDYYNSRIRKVTINTIPSITGITSFCEGSTVTLSSPSVYGNWSSSNTSIATIGSVSGIVTGVSAGTAVITYRIGTDCATALTTTTITVDTIPTKIVRTDPVCVGLTTTLSNGVAGGTWSSGITSRAVIGSTSGEVTGISAGTSVITYTLGTGCRVTRTVTVNALSAITGATNVCEGKAITLADATAGGTWSSSNTVVATIGSTKILTGLSGGAVSVYYIMPTGCTATKAVTVNPSPTAITGTSYLFNGTSTTLSNGLGGGIWSSSVAAKASIGSVSGVVSGVSTGTSTISYTSTGNCRVTRVVTVAPVPGAITGPTSVCEGQTIKLTQGTAGGTWSSSNTAVATVGSTKIVSGVSAGTVIISYMLPGGGLATIAVTVNPAPTAITGTTAICAGGSVTLSDGAAGGMWSSSATVKATIGSVSGIVAGIAAGTSKITYTLGGSCSAIVTVSVLPLPAAIGGPVNMCEGKTITITETTAGGAWSSSNTTVATVGSLKNVIGLSAGTATISYVLLTGCQTTRDVTVNPISAIAGPSAVCAGQSITLSDAISGGVWSSSMATKATAGSASGIISGVAAGTTTISYTLATGCRTTQGVTVNALPMTGIITGIARTNVGAATTLSDGVAGGVWGSGNTAIATVGSTGIVTGSGVGIAVISYSVTNASSCTASALKSVSVTPEPAPGDGATNSMMVLCEGSRAALAAPVAGGEWKSSNTKIAEVDVNGMVAAKAAGIATITFSKASNTGAPLIEYTPVLVHPLPGVVRITATPGAHIVAGEVVTFKASVQGTAVVTYQWLLNGAAITGATNATYTCAACTNGDEISCRVTDINGCGVAESDKIVITVVATVVPTVAAAVLKVVPNPAHDEIAIENASGRELRVYNIVGQEVYRVVILSDKATVSVSGLVPGMYMLSFVKSDGSREFVRLVRE